MGGFERYSGQFLEEGEGGVEVGGNPNKEENILIQRLLKLTNKHPHFLIHHFSLQLESAENSTQNLWLVAAALL